MLGAIIEWARRWPAVKRAVDRDRARKAAATRAASERAPARAHVDEFRQRLGLSPWAWGNQQGEH